jgi:predicted DNA-binding transcriptional regulator YafY
VGLSPRGRAGGRGWGGAGPGAGGAPPRGGAPAAVGGNPRPRRTGAEEPPPAPPEDEGQALAAAGPFGLGLEDDGFRAVVADAARERRRCRIHYLKPGRRAPEERVIRPYLLLHSEGYWYVAGHDEAREAPRVFRMDRILDAALEPDRFEAPADLDPSAFLSEDGRVYRADDETAVRVRYSPAVARWIEERMEAVRQPDGSVIATHEVADTQWLLRHVLQYGPDAEVLAPAEARRAAAEVVARMAAG